MKRILLTGLFLLSIGQISDVLAQSKHDDIYYNAKDAEKDAEEQAR